jgi:hypothetical protein
MASKRTQNKKARTGLMIRCTDEIGEALKAFCEGRDMKPATLARVGLRFCIKELVSGRACIVNGELQPVKK